jgi:hypothetical protein
VETEISLGAADLRAMKLALMCLFDHATVYKAVQATAFPELRNCTISIMACRKIGSQDS